MGPDRRRGGRRKEWVGGATGLAVIGILLGLVFGVFLDESPSHANTTPNGNSAAGIGPATKVSDPPPANESAALTQKIGVCKVPIRSYYSRPQWRAQVKCIEGWGFDHQLLTVKDAGPVPVYLNEWYGSAWHGETTISPGQTIIMPLWGGVAPSIWVGACWTDHAPYCKLGADHQVADVDFIRMVPARGKDWLMFVRDWNNQGIPAVDGKQWAAVNIGNYAVQLHWKALGDNNWVDLAPGKTIDKIPPGDIEGRKQLGSGAVALVQLVPTPHETGAELYRMISPSTFHGHQLRYAIMTLLIGGNWCSAQLQNLGPELVRFQVWAVPYLQPSGPDMALGSGQSGLLNVRGATLITGLVGTSEVGSFTTIKALKWNECPN